jgi:hypothetical protein
MRIPLLATYLVEWVALFLLPLVQFLTRSRASYTSVLTTALHEPVSVLKQIPSFWLKLYDNRFIPCSFQLIFY